MRTMGIIIAAILVATAVASLAQVPGIGSPMVPGGGGPMVPTGGGGSSSPPATCSNSFDFSKACNTQYIGAL